MTIKKGEEEEKGKKEVAGRRYKRENRRKRRQQKKGKCNQTNNWPKTFRRKVAETGEETNKNKILTVETKRCKCRGTMQRLL